MLLVAFATNTNAQGYQLRNNNFESWGSANKPNNWNSYDEASGSLSGMLPDNSDNIFRRSGNPGGSGSYFLTVAANKKVWGVLANGNITTGRMNAGSASPSGSGNNNQTITGNSQFSQAFTATPDSVSFWVSFYAGSTSAYASVRFYVHGNSNFTDHPDEDMNDATKYCRRAVCEFTRTTGSASSRTWVQKKFPFTSGTSTANYVLATIATNKTAGSGTLHDSISIDDIVFIYSAWATGITFNGTAVPGFSKGNFGDYVMSVDYVSDLDGLTPSDFNVTTEVSDVTKTITFVEENGFTYNGRPARRAKIHILAEDQVTYKDYYVIIYAINDDPSYYTLTATANPTAGGTVTMNPAGGTYIEGSSVQLTATANTGYNFTQWSDGVTTNTRTVTVNADASYEAQFALQQFTVTTNVTPAEGGSVTGGGSYNYGSTATLVATPNAGYEFVEWNDHNTNSTRVVTVTEDVTYTATFQLQSHAVTVNVDDPSHGTVSGGGSYIHGTEATVQAYPAEDYHFLRWNDGTPTNPYTFTVTEPKSLIAYFEMDEITYYTVTVNSANPAMGTVSGTGSVREGRTTQISATANTGYHFTQWQDGNTDNPRTITVNGNVTYTASFAPNTYTITALSADNAMGTVEGGGQYDYATTATLTANPITGYRFVEWDDHNTQNPREVSVIGDATYTASFEQITYTVTATANNAQFGTVSGSGVYNYGAAVTLTATAEDGYHFVQWSDGTTANPYQFNIFENKNITAIFEEDGVVINYYTVTVSAANPTTGSVTGGGVYEENTTATIEAVPANGYEFVEWNDHVTTNPRSFTVTSDVEYVATFQAINYELTVVANPAEGGVVTGGGSYQYGATATLTATANLGYAFTGWNDGILTASRQVTVAGNATYTANFVQEEYQINITVSNAAYGTTSGSGTYYYGEMVTAQATANQGFRFVQWSNGVTDNPYTFAATGSLTLNAEFVSDEVQFYTVTVASENTEMGGVSGAGSYPAGSTVSVEALPNFGYRFVQWQDGVTTNPRTFAINSDMSFIASFEEDEFAVTLTVNDPAMGSVMGGGVYPYMTQINAIAIPNEGYHFVRWDGAEGIINSKSMNDTLELTVNGNINLMAVFAEDEVIYYTITVSTSNEAMGTATGGGLYRAGETIEIQAIPNANYAFSRWREDGNVDNPRTIVVEGDRTYTAIFQYSGAVSNVPNGHIIAWCEDGRLFVKGVENHDVIITDMMGRVIYRAEQCLYDTFDIDVPAEGIYLVHADGVATKKVFVKK